MKKSEIYRLAQVAVLAQPLTDSVKITVLRELMVQEDLAKFCEQQEEKENAVDRDESGC